MEKYLVDQRAMRYCCFSCGVIRNNMQYCSIPILPLQRRKCNRRSIVPFRGGSLLPSNFFLVSLLRVYIQTAAWQTKQFFDLKEWWNMNEYSCISVRKSYKSVWICLEVKEQIPSDLPRQSIFDLDYFSILKIQIFYQVLINIILAQPQLSYFISLGYIDGKSQKSANLVFEVTSLFICFHHLL